MPLFSSLVRTLNRRPFWCGFLLFSGFCLLGWLTAEFTVLAQRRTPVRRSEGRSSSKLTKKTTRSRTALARVPVQQQTAPDGSLIGQPWTGGEGLTESTADIMQRERLRATQPQLKTREEEHELERPDRRNLPQNPNALSGFQWPFPEEGRREGERDSGTAGQREPSSFSPSHPLSLSPSLSPQPVTLNFTGATLADSGAYPPDAMGAVGPTQFLMALNGRIRVFDKNTGALGPLDADSDNFFEGVRGGAFTSDPRVRFDRLSGRWFIVMINVPASVANNSILLAVSDGATITANTMWRKVAFQQHQPPPAGDAGCFADYPTLGIDAQALYIGVNQFCSERFSGTAAFVVRKSALLNGGALVVTAFRNLTGTPEGTGPYTPQGVDNFDPNANVGYLIGADNATLGTLVVRRVSNPGGTPTLSPNLLVNILSTAPPIKVRHAGNTNGANGYLDAIDDRLFAAQMRNGRLWTTQNIAVSNTGTTEGNRTRNASRWYELGGLDSSTPYLIQAGTLFAETAANSFDDRHYFMPSIMVSGQGHAALGCSVTGANEAINAATAGRLATDPLGALRTPLVFTNSNSAYNPPRNTGNQDGFRRWGDYSYTSVDPCDDMTMWTIQQFCDAPDSYGVRIAKLQAPPPATPLGVNPPSLAAGQASANLTITGAALNGAGFFDPGNGFSCRLQAHISGGVTVNGLTYLNPTTLSLNVSTVNASAGLKNITITNPDGQTVTSSNLLTIGNCAYTVAPAAQTFTAAGGNGSLNVTATSGCGWTAVSNDPFLTIVSGNTGNGSGTVNFNLASTVAGSRTGTLTVAGQTVTITQDAGAGCNYTLTPANRQISAQGGYGTISVTAPMDCAWTATTNSSFVSLLLGTAGQGNGTLNYLVAPNATPIARNATINAGGQAFLLTQEAAPFEIAVDDGTLETSSGLGGGGTSVRVNRLTPSSYPATLGAISIFFPDGVGLTVGDPLTLLAGTNPAGAANIDGTVFQETSVTIKALGEFNVYTLATPITINAGDFVVGLRLTHAEGAAPFARDTSTPSQRRSYRQLQGQSAFQLIDDPPVNTPGNYGIRAQLIRPAILLVKGGAALAAESCQPANGAIDPGETVTVNVTVQNNGANSTGNLLAALQATGGVGTAGVSQSFGAITPGTAVTRAFSFTANGDCGGKLTMTLKLSDGGQDLGTQSYSFVLGTPAAISSTYSFTGPPAAIPDADARGVNVPLMVSGFNGALADLNLRFDGAQCTGAAGATTVGLSHDFAGDLVVKLTSPQGTTVTLMNRPGGVNNNGRNFCQTLLDDDAANAISIQQVSPSPSSPVGPPYLGTFLPANPLSAFDGENPNGTWTLNVADVDASATGFVRGFSLILSGFTCCQSSQPLAHEGDVAPRPNGNGATTAADWTLMGRFVVGLITPDSGSEFQRADCAPRETLGDGRLTAADYTQAGRYVAGLDPLTAAGGPLAPNALLANQARTFAETGSRAITLPAHGGGTQTIVLTLAAAGHENALSASLGFDPARWQFVSASVGQNTPNAMLVLNETQLNAGQLGFVLALPAGQTLPPGQAELVQLSFKPVLRRGGGPLVLRFHDEVVVRELVDAQAQVLQIGNQLSLGVSFARFAMPERQRRAAPAWPQRVRPARQ